MTENFDVNTLRENLHTNLSLVIKQIDEYSNKFINKLIDALQRNMSQNRLLDTKSDLKRVDYKIKNDITDNIYFTINDLIKSIKETTTSKDLTEKINKYMANFDLFKNSGLNILDDVQDEVMYNLKKNEKYDDIASIRRIFDSYRESINFAIKSLDKKVNELVRDSLNKFNKEHNSLVENKDLLLSLSFFNITYDKDNDTLLIDDNGTITKLEKIDENTYKIKDNINLVLMKNKDVMGVGITIDGDLKKAVSINDKLNNIVFLTKKKDESKGLEYNFDNGFIRTYENNSLVSSDMINLDKLDKKIEDTMNGLDTNILSLIRQLEKNRIKTSKNELAFK